MTDMKLKAAIDRISNARQKAAEMASSPLAREISKVLAQRTEETVSDVKEIAQQDRIEALADKLLDVLDAEHVNNATVFCALAALVSDFLINHAIGDATLDGKGLGFEITITGKAFDFMLKEQIALKVAILANERDEAKAATKN